MLERFPILTLILMAVGAMAFGVLALWMWFAFGFLWSIALIIAGTLAIGWLAQHRPRFLRHD